MNPSLNSKWWRGLSQLCCKITEIFFLRPDFQEITLLNPDFELFVDGSASHNSENKTESSMILCGNCTWHMAYPLSSSRSAQAAELTALTEECKLSQGKSVNIFTDNRCRFDIVHDFVNLWKHIWKVLWHQLESLLHTDLFVSCWKPAS